MGIGNIMSFVNNTPWAMEETALTSLVGVLDLKVVDPTAFQALVGLEQNTKFAESESSAWETDYLISKSNKSYDYVKVTGTLVPRTGSMRPYCGSTPTIGLANLLTSSSADHIILHLDSGGGAVTAIQETASVIRAMVDSGKEVIAYTDTMMCSAAYWLASACSSIVAAPSAFIGNIGVYSVLTKNVNTTNQKSTVIRAGKNKAFGNPNLEASDEELAYFQSNVNSIYDLFTGDVAKYRGVTQDQIKGTEANAYRASEAPSFLVDHVMTLTELLTMVQES